MRQVLRDRAISKHTHLLSKRAEIKQLLKTLRETNPDVEKNVFSAIHAVSLDTMPGWKIGEKEYSFLDDYDHWEATHRPADK